MVDQDFLSSWDHMKTNTDFPGWTLVISSAYCITLLISQLVYKLVNISKNKTSLQSVHT